MNLKDKLIRRLLDIGKKHRILVYPTLALVAVISAVSHMVCWGKGNGKRVVASVMIMALLITQSLFLTSSADTPQSPEGGNVASATDAGYVPDGENDGVVSDEEDSIQNNLAALSNDGAAVQTVQCVRIDETGAAVNEITKSLDDTDSINTAGIRMSEMGGPSDANTGCFQINWYTDSQCTNEVSGSVNFSGVDAPQLYCRITRVKYIVDMGDGIGGTSSIEEAIASPVPGAMTPQITYVFPESLSTGRKGYEYAGVICTDYNYAGYGVFKDKNGDRTISYVLGVDSTVPLTAQWEGRTFDITFDIASSLPTGVTEDDLQYIEGQAEGTTRVISDLNYSDYDAGKTAYQFPSGWAKAEGYIVTGWSDGTKVYSLNTDYHSDDITTGDYSGIQGKRFTAIWTYQGFKMNSEQGNSIKCTYGDSIDYTAYATYADNSEGTFAYEVSDADKNKLASYGLDCEITDKGVKISGSADTVTAATEQITITAKDAKHADVPAIDYVVDLTIGKRKVQLNSDSVKGTGSSARPYKTYDGKSDIEISNTASVANKVAADDVSIIINGKGDGTLAELTDVNAGTNRDLILYGVELAGADADNYELEYYTATGIYEGNKAVLAEGVAWVDQKTLTISMRRRDNATGDIYFGQATPDYIIALTDASQLAEADRNNYNSLTSDAAKDEFIRSTLLGGFTFKTDRELYSEAGRTYEIWAWSEKQDGRNYVIATGCEDTITVIRENGEGLYTYSTEKGANGYYPGLTIIPKEGYTIRLLEDGDSDLTGNVASTDFTASAVIKNMKDETIRFQMMNTSNGSVSTIVTDVVSVDDTVPLYRSHRVEQVDNINVFDFGSYYHTVDGIDWVKLTLTYKAEFSSCDMLYYYFVDETGNRLGDYESTVEMKQVSQGVYEASFTFSSNQQAGQIVVYATNEAGGKSEALRLKMADDKSPLHDMYDPAMPGNGYFEWMVENTPADASIQVLTSSDTPVDGGADLWYNGLNCMVNAKDDDSGIWKIKWTVADAAGNAVAERTDIAADMVPVIAQKTYGKVTECMFTYLLGEDLKNAGAYTVSAVLYDNAGNVTDIDTVGPYKIDSIKPLIEVDDSQFSDNLASDISLVFDVSEGNNESGLASVELYKDDTKIQWWPISDEKKFNIHCQADITANGTYRIVARDLAGNEAVYTKTFGNISVVPPDAPVITVDGILGNDGWYIEAPTVHITAASMTPDNVGVTTSYTVTVGNISNTVTMPSNQNEVSFEVTNNGVVLIKAESVSEAGLKSDASTELKIDTNPPDVEITSSTIDSNGDVVINFHVSDAESGVDINQVKINGVPISVSNVDGVVTGSFKAEGAKEYTISVCDIAGNAAEDKSFFPLGLKVNPITNITRDGAYLEAWVFEGTNEISDCYIAYKEASGASYKTALSNKHKESYGYSMDYTFNNLKSDTVYDYKVYAITKVSKEVKTYEGRFRTNSNQAGGTIYGSAVYDDSLSNSYPRYPIFVSLYDANTFIASVKLKNENDSDYTFKNIPDGSYRIVATDGTLTDTKAVTVVNGGIRFPEDYAENGGVNFVLDGMSTSVVVEDNAINITADNLKSVFDTSVSEAVITSEDKEVLAAGGTIDISLHASYIDVSDISSEERGIFNAKLGGNTVIERYINLFVLKEVRDADGNYVNGTPVKLPELYNPITVSFPLGDLAGQKIYVAAVHGEGTDYSFMDWANADNVTLSRDSVTITTRYFSTYALYRVLPSDKSYTVTWKDGDGKTMKTETVKEGSAATPPTQVPTKTASANYTYSFSGWDTDYMSITKDTVISARFTAKRIDDGKAPSNPGEKPADVNKNPNGYTYLGSADSPRTGDAAPIVLLVFIMAVSGVGLLILRKKQLSKR